MLDKLLLCITNDFLQDWSVTYTTLAIYIIKWWYFVVSSLNSIWWIKMKGYRSLKLFFLWTNLEHTGAIGIMLLWVIKISKMQHELKQHVRFHTKEKLYKCEICQCKFRLKYHTFCHTIGKHSHEKRFCGNVCGKSFVDNKELARYYWCTKET